METGPENGPLQIVPEPASVTLLLIGGLCVLGIRRRPGQHQAAA